MNADAITFDKTADVPVSADPIPLAPIVRLLLKPAEAAAALAISPRLLWSKTKRGEIPCVRIGKAVRYLPSALQRTVEKLCGE